jgi:hypothetical protein
VTRAPHEPLDEIFQMKCSYAGRQRPVKVGAVRVCSGRLAIVKQDGKIQASGLAFLQEAVRFDDLRRTWW